MGLNSAFISAKLSIYYYYIYIWTGRSVLWFWHAQESNKWPYKNIFMIEAYSVTVMIQLFWDNLTSEK